MKMTKRILALALCLMLMVALAVPAMAASGTNDNTGSITINNAHEGFTYSIYQILKLESYNTDDSTYIYSVTSNWLPWVEDASLGGKYLLITDGTVKWNGVATDATKKAFVEEALAYAKANSIASEASIKFDSHLTEVKFTGLNLGYYLVDSSAGALCSIDTVLPDATLEEKNLIPTNEKKVQDTHDGTWDDNTVGYVGQTINFSSTVIVYSGIENLVFHDKMDTTLDFKYDSVDIKVGSRDGASLDPAYYTVSLSPTCGKECTFDITFTEDYLKSVTEKTELFIMYQGVLNENASVISANINESGITYGDDGWSDWDKVEINTYYFGIVKTNISNKILTGAEFDLYRTLTGDKTSTGEDSQIYLVEEAPGAGTGLTAVAGVKYYRPATETEIAEIKDPANPRVSAKIQVGQAIIWGVRTGVPMYLEETRAPDGYNKLTARHQIPALTGNNGYTLEAEGIYASGGVEVENLAGAQLPQTGGIGTTLFYVFGGLMLVGAAVLLITKRRMADEI